MLIYIEKLRAGSDASINANWFTRNNLILRAGRDRITLLQSFLARWKFFVTCMKCSTNELGPVYKMCRRNNILSFYFAHLTYNVPRKAVFLYETFQVTFFFFRRSSHHTHDEEHTTISFSRYKEVWNESL